MSTYHYTKRSQRDSENANEDYSARDPFPPSQRHAYSHRWSDIGHETESETRLNGTSPNGAPTTQRKERLHHLLGRVAQSRYDNEHGEQASENSLAVKSLGKRPTGSLPMSNTATEDVIKQKKRRLLEMDDWTGSKALKPLEMSFPQFDSEGPVWGWGDATQSSQTTSQPRISTASQQQPSSSNDIGTKPLFSVQPPQQPPYRSRWPSSINILPLAPSSLSPPPYRHTRVHSRQSSSTTRSLGRPSTTQTSPLFALDKCGTKTPRTGSVYRASGIPGVSQTPTPILLTVPADSLSEEEQRRFDSEGFAIVSPSAYGVPVLGTPMQRASQGTEHPRHTQNMQNRGQAAVSNVLRSNAAPKASQAGSLSRKAPEDPWQLPRETTIGLDDEGPWSPEDEVASLIDAKQLSSSVSFDEESEGNRESELPPEQEETGVLRAPLMNIRDIPDCDKNDDPIEDSESDQEVMRAVQIRKHLIRTTTGQSGGRFKCL